MAGLEIGNPDQPDETRPFVAKGRADAVNLAGRIVLRGVFEPGWKWSEHVKPLAGTDSCQVSHFGYCVSGRMTLAMDDGNEQELGAGTFFAIPSGHDAWTVGDEPCVLVDFGEVEQYAKGS